MEKRDRILLKATLDRPDITMGALDILCGKFIGEGSSRAVFELLLDKDYVVKIQMNNGNDNVMEYEVWNLVSQYNDKKAVSKWFAPCSYISDNGTILLQKRTQHVHSRKIPDKIPGFLTDIKADNFGWIGKQLVAHDYGDILVRLGFYGFNKRMRNSKKILYS